MARSPSPVKQGANGSEGMSPSNADKTHSGEQSLPDSKRSNKSASQAKLSKSKKSKDKSKDKEKERSKERESKRRRHDSQERTGDHSSHKRSRHSSSKGKEAKEPSSRNTQSAASSKKSEERISQGSKTEPTSGKPEDEGKSSQAPQNASHVADPSARASKADKAVAEPSKKPSNVTADEKVASAAIPRPRTPEAAPKKAEPLSLEELLRRRAAAALAASKPVFLSKKQREELALKRRQEEVDAKAAAAEAAATERSNGPGVDSRHADRRRDDRSDDRRPDRSDDRRPDRYDDRRNDRQLDDRRPDDRRGDRRHDDRRVDRRPADRRDDRRGDSLGDADRQQRDADRERNKELEMIKAQYLGEKKKKKKVLKGAEKFKFNFDWAADDDTSRDLNPLYNSTHESALLFGRGLKAGVDRREQKKQAAGHEAELLRKVREAQGIKETREDRQRDRNRQALAEGYEPSSMKMGQHWKEKTRDEMTERDWRIFREDYNIGYKGAMDKSTLPIRNWSEAKLPDVLVKAVETMGYTEPSPIQMAAIPLGMQFRDVIGVAETGSGKTAAFVLPMLTYILGQPVMTEEVAAEGPYAVIMAPTRELAQQIEDEALKMAQYTEFRFVCVVGGQNIEEQGFKLRKGCEVIIATPGRLIDCLEQRYAVLNQCNYIVLDEADRMIDLGFEPQVIGVMDAMPTSHLKPEGEDVALEINRVYRTTYMFSATMPMAVERLARKYLRRPVVINIGSAGKAVDLITQRIMIVKENEKAKHLERELSYVGDKRVVVFVNTKRQCDVVAKVLGEHGVQCTILHGGKSQDQREAGLAGFREGLFTVLVATDVAGRGIDVPDVALVCNYDMPNSIENYTHRIGRTGRAGRMGTAVTFLTMSDTEVFYDLKKFLEESKASVPPQLASHEAARTKPGSVENRRDKIQYAKK